MTIEVKPNGILISDIIDGCYIKRLFLFHSLTSAKKEFKRYVKELTSVPNWQYQDRY